MYHILHTLICLQVNNQVNNLHKPPAPILSVMLLTQKHVQESNLPWQFCTYFFKKAQYIRRSIHVYISHPEVCDCESSV